MVSNIDPMSSHKRGSLEVYAKYNLRMAHFNKGISDFYKYLTRKGAYAPLTPQTTGSNKK